MRVDKSVARSVDRGAYSRYFREIDPGANDHGVLMYSITLKEIGLY